MSDEKLIKYLKGQSQSTEKKEIEQWLQESANNSSYLAELKKRYESEQFAAQMLTYDVDAAYQKVNKRLLIADRKKRFLKIRYIAAILILALISGSVIYTLQHRTNQFITLESDGSTSVSHTFSDGSKVTLNKNSRIVFPKHFARNERRVTLDGEAYFEIEKNLDSPFYVQTEEQFEIKVLGTKFNLQAYSGDSIVETSLYEGSIGLKDANLLAESLLILSPTEKFVINKSSKDIYRGTTTKYNTADWMFDRQVFDDTTLPEVLRVLSHQFNVDVEMSGSLLSTYSFTGTFENRTLHQILKYIQISSNINFKIEKQQNGKDLVTISSTV